MECAQALFLEHNLTHAAISMEETFLRTASQQCQSRVLSFRVASMLRPLFFEKTGRAAPFRVPMDARPAVHLQCDAYNTSFFFSTRKVSKCATSPSGAEFRFPGTLSYTKQVTYQELWSTSAPGFLRKSLRILGHCTGLQNSVR